MSEFPLEQFRSLADAMRSEPEDWQWLGAFESQRMFGITEARATAYAERHGGVASRMVSPEAEADRASILRSAEGAPLNAAHFMNPEIAGWWTPSGLFICDHDSARIFARGCRMPEGSTPAWRSSEPRGVCVVCGK